MPMEASTQRVFANCGAILQIGSTDYIQGRTTLAGNIQVMFMDSVAANKLSQPCDENDPLVHLASGRNQQALLTCWTCPLLLFQSTVLICVDVCYDFPVTVIGLFAW